MAEFPRSQGAPMAERRNELLIDVAAHAADVARDHNIPGHIAEQIGCAIADRLADNWGGQLITFPKDCAYRLSQRDIALYADFTGNNHSALAKKYGIGTRAIYKLIARFRARSHYLNQPDLFSVGVDAIPAKPSNNTHKKA